MTVYCSQCGGPVRDDQKHCTKCGAAQQPSSLKSQTQPAAAFSATSAGTTNQVCGYCHTQLIWAKKPVPTWAWIMSVVGVLMILTFILMIPGFIVWAIGLYGILKKRSLEPYCPQCRLFFPLAATAATTARSH